MRLDAMEPSVSSSQKQVDNTVAEAAVLVGSFGEERRVGIRPSITRSSKWVVAGTVLSKPIQLFTIILIARLLGPASFGVFGLASSLAGTLSLMAGLGLGDAINKYLAEYHQKDNEKGTQLASVIIWTAVSCTVFFLAVLWVARSLWVGRVFPLATSTRLVALCLCLTLGNLLLVLLLGVFSGLQRFREFTILNLIQAAAIAVFAASLAFYGSEGAMLAYTIGTFAAVAWGAWKLWGSERKILTWPGLHAFRNLKTILNFSVPIWVGAIAFPPFATFTLVFLAHQANGASELGIFNTANGLRMLVALVPAGIAAAIAPALLQEGGTHGDAGAYARLIDKSFAALVFLTLVLFIPCLFLSDLIFTIYGRAYTGAFRLFMPLTASAAIGAIGALLPTVMLAKNRTWWAFVFGFIKSALMVALAVLWVPRFFATGLTWAVVTSEIVIYFSVLEFCIFIKALPGKLRLPFYSAVVVVLILMTLAMFAPEIVRWLLALPLTAAVVIYFLRTHNEMADWLTSLVPAPLKPRAQRILSFIAA